MTGRIGGEDIARGIALRIAAAGAFSVMSAVLKLASLDGVVAPEMLFYRAFFGLPDLGPIRLHEGRETAHVMIAEEGR